MKKRGIVFMLVAVMLMQLLSGCSLGKASGDNGNGGSGAGTLQLGIVAKGYGDTWLKELAKAYEAKTGTKTVVVKSTAKETALRGMLTAGAKNNDIDVFFDIWPNAMNAVATANYVDGYERCFVSLSDIYDEVLEGYGTDKTLEETVMPYALRACTWGGKDAGYGDGNQYFVSYATGMEGLVYNKDLFDKYDLKLPKTTTEFFALLDQIKTINNGKYAKNEEGRTIYPYVYSGKAAYSYYLATSWWAQYDGVDGFNKALEGKDANGYYSAESLKSPGKLLGMTYVSKLLNQNNGYVDSSDYSTSFTNAQLLFLDNQAFMMSTGEWMEREMEANFKDGSANVAFMRLPVSSDIVQKCDSVKTEAQLVETIAYIDGDTDVRPAYLSDADLARIKEARGVFCCEGNQHLAYIPAYSNMVEDAKDFLLFMLSKEGQEIMMKYSFGNTAPLNVDVTKFAGYDSISTFQQSKYDMQVSSVGVNLIGNNFSHPMAYAGGIQPFYNAPSLEVAFGVVETSESFMTAEELWLAEYKKIADSWNSYLAKAGVSN